MMKTILVSVLGVGLAVSAASAATLNVRVEGCTGTCDEAVMGAPWSTAFDVEPGQTVHYRVVGEISPADPADNQGLALFGFDLGLSCGGVDEPLAQASAPITTTTPGIEEFQIPNGITNPAGFGGTTNVPGMEGKLVQVGGAWNTINNVPSNAEYPIGGPVLDLGHTPAVLAVGQLTIPEAAADGTKCDLVLSNLFANVVDPAATETDAFWRVLSADPDPAPDNLSMTVVTEPCAAFASSSPACDGILARSQGNCVLIQFGGTVASPVPGTDIRVVRIPDETDVTSDFTFEVVGANDTLKVTNTGTPVANQEWYAIQGLGGCFTFDLQFGVVYGDANGDGTTNAFDLNAIWQNRANPLAECSPLDVNGDGAIDAFDLNAAWANRNSEDPGKPVGFDCVPTP